MFRAIFIVAPLLGATTLLLFSLCGIVYIIKNRCNYNAFIKDRKILIIIVFVLLLQISISINIILTLGMML